jgi:DNA polymerase III subunit delta'
MSWINCNEQPKVTAILQKSLMSGRVPHAYLFTGKKGVGKKKVAIQLAKSLFCTEYQGDSCDHCLNCHRIESGNHPDVFVVSPDGNSIKIDQVRELQKEFSFRAVESNRKVYIIEQAEKMTVQAANSLLKFLEEPNYQVTAILSTEHVHQILPTILSRCQVMSFQELPLTQRVQVLLQEGFFEPLVRNACQMTADLEQARELCQSDSFAQARNVVLQLSQDILDKGSYALVILQDKVVKQDNGEDGITVMLDFLLYWYRDILLFQIDRNAELVNTDMIHILEQQAMRCSRTWLLRAVELVADTVHRLNRHANAQLALERMVISLQDTEV